MDLLGCFPGPDARWLYETPTVGAVAPGDSVAIDVLFDATGLAGQTVQGNIVIGCNDPDEHCVRVPVRMEVLGCTGGPNVPLYTDKDNEDNVLSGSGDCDMDLYLFNSSPVAPMELSVLVPDADALTHPRLLVYNWDVDETNGEVDEVYFNGHYLGTLTGADGMWSTTALPFDPAWAVSGDNLVEILVDTANPLTPTWAVNVDWVQIDSGAPGEATIQYLNILTPPPYLGGDTLAIEIEVDTTQATQQVRIEANLLSPDGTIIDGWSTTHVLVDAVPDPVVATLTIPPGSPTGFYPIQVLVYGEPSGLYQDSQARILGVGDIHTSFLPLVLRAY
jgi:hypothetical protein